MKCSMKKLPKSGLKWDVPCTKLTKFSRSVYCRTKRFAYFEYLKKKGTFDFFLQICFKIYKTIKEIAICLWILQQLWVKDFSQANKI